MTNTIQKVNIRSTIREVRCKDIITKTSLFNFSYTVAMGNVHCYSTTQTTQYDNAVSE
jgi:hypothetical protein